MRDAASSEILAETFAPRNDLAQPVSWDLTAHMGKKGILEIVDGDNGSAFAWIAAGRFNPAVVPMPAISPSLTSQRQQASAELAGSLRIEDLAIRFLELLASDSTELEARAAMARSLAVLRPSEKFATLAPLVGDATLPASVRSRISAALANPNSGDPHSIVIEVIQTAPYRGQVKLVQAVAGNPRGAERIIGMTEAGQLSPRLLQERSVAEKLKATLDPSASGRLAKLMAKLPPMNQEIARLVENRRAGYNPVSAKPVQGAALFNQHCAACHQIDGRGGLVGPQLDGIGNRGLERLCEDILDPNRNVDVAFRSQLIVLKDGDVISGLLRREEGETLVVADATGKEQLVPKKSVQERRPSELSLMPENIGELLSQEDFNHLLSFLLSKGSVGR